MRPGRGFSKRFQRQRDDLLGKRLLAEALETGIETWRDWPCMKRRSFLKQVAAVSRLKVMKKRATIAF